MFIPSKPAVALTLRDKHSKVHQGQEHHHSERLAVHQVQVKVSRVAHPRRRHRWLPLPQDKQVRIHLHDNPNFLDKLNCANAMTGKISFLG